MSEGAKDAFERTLRRSTRRIVVRRPADVAVTSALAGDALSGEGVVRCECGEWRPAESPCRLGLTDDPPAVRL